MRRVANSWKGVYQHYADYWRFQLQNPGENYRHYLRFRHRQQARNNQNGHHAQARLDSQDYTEVTE